MISALQTFRSSHALSGMQNSLVWGELCFPKSKTMTFNSEFLQGLDEITTGKTRMAVHVNYFRNSQRVQINHLPSKETLRAFSPSCPRLLFPSSPHFAVLIEDPTSPVFLWRKKKMHKADFCKANCLFPEAHSILPVLLWPSYGIDLWLAACLLTR